MPIPQGGCFKGRTRNLVQGRDYQIRTIFRRSEILVMAFHGGKVEPGTSEIAEAIATSEFSLYCLDSLEKRANSLLHIGSHRFDELRALQMISKSSVIITVHGQNDRVNEFIIVGGLNSELRSYVEKALRTAGFETRPLTPRLAGYNPANICNKGRSSPGVQLEISRKLREALKRDRSQLHLFASTIRKAIHIYLRRNRVKETERSGFNGKNENRNNNR